VGCGGVCYGGCEEVGKKMVALTYYFLAFPTSIGVRVLLPSIVLKFGFIYVHIFEA
jgi:hypothetical protein